MVRRQIKNFKLWRVMVLAVICWVIGSGFWQDLSADNEATYKGLKIFSDVLDIVEQSYVEPVESRELIEKAIQGMVQSLDPHSAFLPPEALEALQMDTQGEFGGIGIEITMQKGILTVISPIEGTPASRAGIEAGDHIIKVDGASTKDMMLWDAVKRMRGLKGTKVVITVWREGVNEPIDFELVRDIIPIESVRYLTLKPGYGYIWVTNFRESTTQDIRGALETFEKEDAPLKGLILDLRYNPGGLLNQSVEVADLFIEEGTIVSMKGRRAANTKVFNATANKVKRDYPIVVLINSGSASASEIVAGALQDHKRALILGTTSFGKGSVQNVESLGGGYGLKLTIARYYTPNGRSIQAHGIEPDIVVEQKTIEDIKPAEKKPFMIKEKDLKNHLEPEENEPVETEPTTEKPEKSTKEKLSRHGPLTAEKLKSDWQVTRALEILISYDIFKGMNG
jgi:carboxyl-terminal processing protease